MSILLTFGLGFLLGLQHAADPDHLAAVATFVTRTKRVRDAARLGVWWGLGHTTTLLLVGLAVLIFKLAIPPRLALSFELLVGVMLVVLGVNLLRKLVTGQTHYHKHDHAGAKHSHWHSHEHTRQHSHRHLSFATGLLHGLAGSAALALLTLATVPSLGQGMIFIALFGLGSILGMLMASAALSITLLRLRRYRHALSATTALAGIFSVGIGIIILESTAASLFYS